MNNDNVQVGTVQFHLRSDNNGNMFVDTNIKVSMEDYSSLLETQISFDTINEVMNVCDEFKKIHPNFTKSTDKLMNIFVKHMKLLRQMIRDKHSVLLANAEYTLEDIENAGLGTAIHYKTLNLILLREETK